MIEEWLPVADWPEYEVSNLGRVRRFETGRVRSPILMKSTGYLMVSMSRPGGERKLAAIHRLVALAFLGQPPEEGMQVNHKDSDRTNPKLENLEWVTISQNICHGYTHGRCNATGAANGHSKLTDAAVLDIRGLLYLTAATRSLSRSASMFRRPPFTTWSLDVHGSTFWLPENLMAS